MALIKKIKLSYTQTIALGFLTVVLVGTVLLCLPFSTRAGVWTNPLDALFTAMSATCVTGLVVYDTYTYWSVIGQIVILCMMQIGGIGFMTLVTMISVFRKRKIGLHERQLIVKSTGMLNLAGIVKLIKRIVIGSLCFEAAGAAVLAIRLIPQMGIIEGLYNAVFHSVSAFCNAGFDLMGKYKEFSSITEYVGEPLVSLTLSFLITVGGVGFIVWDDVIKNKFNVRKYSLHSKIVLSVSFLLIATGWIFFFALEFNESMKELTLGEKIITSLFQSVTVRTAGFGIIDTATLSDSGLFLAIVLMFIGGSSGSTAGGIKTTTVAVLVLGALASAQRKRHLTVFKRRIEGQFVREASAFVTVYLGVVIIAIMAVCLFEPFPLKDTMFEVVSAIGTNGLSTGITPFLSAASKVVIIMLMFIGRVGWLTLVYALAGKYNDPPMKRVSEKVLIG